MRRKNLLLIGLLTILILANLGLFSWNSMSDSLSYDPQLFSVNDTTQISAIIITAPGEINKIERNTGWKINGQYASDPNLRKILVAVLNRVRISNGVGSQQKKGILERIKTDGIRVTIELEGGDTIEFYVLGNLNKTKTYFITSTTKDVFEVQIPGYRDYVGGIFELSTNQFRDRVIFNGNRKTIQKLAAAYPNGEKVGFTLTSNNNYFNVSGYENADSLAIINYLKLFEYVQANERISSGSFEAFDSLLQTKPYFQVRLVDIRYPSEITLNFYPVISDDRIQLVTDQNGEMMVFDKKRTMAFFKEATDFMF